MHFKKENEELSEEILRKISEAILILNKSSGEVEYINDFGEKLFNISKKKIIGKNITDLFFNKEDFNKFYNKMLKQLDKRDNHKMELRLKRGLKEDFWSEISFSLIKNSKGKVKKIVFLIRDNTINVKFEESWIRMEELLRGLTSHIQQVREEERIKIARELHDELSPVLTVLKMDLVNISKTLEGKKEILKPDLIVTKISRMEKRIDETIGVIRRIITELRPGVLDDLGLIPAIEWLAEVFNKKSSVSFSFLSDIQDIDLGTSEDTAVFRIVQESITNILRHGQAKFAAIKIKNENNIFEILISDDGIGIKETELFAKKSFGLMGMRERVENFGWELNISGIHNKGTVVKLRIPLLNYGGAK